MRKFTHSSSPPSGAATSAIGLLDSRLVNLLNRTRALGLSPGVVATMGGLVSISLVGWASFRAPTSLNFDYFYLLVCVLVGWIAGTPGALVCSVASAAFLLSSEVMGGVSSAVWVAACNAVVRVLAFVSIGWSAAKVGRSTRSLGHEVQSGTARLQQEVKEHKQTAELLSEATEVFKQLTENIADVFWVTDPSKTQVEYVSPEFEHVWGRSLATLYETPGVWMEGIHHEDRERVTRAMFSKQVTGQYDEEYRVLRPDGSLRWVHDRAFPVRDELGAVYRIVGIAEDITERKRTEHLLQAERDVGVALSSTSDLRYALESLLGVAMQLEGIDCGGVYVADPDSGDLSLEVHRGLSSSFVERIGRYAADATEALLVKSGQSLYLREGEIPRSLDVLWGSEGLRALAMVPIRHKGLLLGMLNLASYRHEEIFPRTRIGVEMIASQAAGAIARIQAEEALRRSEAKLRTIINSAPIALLATDAKGMITFEDGQALGAMGYRPGEHVRRDALEVYRDFPAVQENIRRGLAGEEFSSELEFGPTVFECRYTPVRDKHDSSAGLIAVSVDVTERHRLQREILEISDREQARIGQDIHDGLCQQLIGLAINANSLEQSLTNGQDNRVETARKICRLVDDAITEARGVCQGLYPIRLTTHGLPPALEELAVEVTKRHGVECRCEIEAQRWRCDMQTATHLYRIAQEAVNNSVKYSGAKTIGIKLVASDSGICLEIQDDGQWREHRPARGSGMGMHIMNYRAQLVRGVFSCEPGKNGTRVSCRIATGSAPVGI